MLSLILLVIHIGAGSVALATAAVALFAPKGRRYHILAGRTYAAGMTLVFLTAVPLAILGSSIFLMAGAIATITAVMVVNVDMEPVWVPWILPTIVITPLIVWWNIRTLRPARRQLSESGFSRLLD